MNAKINVKFVFILLLVAFLVTGGVGAVWYLRHNDASRHFNLGDELFAQGEYEAASRQYFRGITRDPGNREYLRKYQDALLQIRPATGVEARELYSRYLTSLQHAVQHHPHIADYHFELIDEFRNNAQMLSMAGGVTAMRSHWQSVASAADDMLLRLPQSDPQYSYGYLYRGLSTAELYRTASDSELDRAIDDLQTFVDANPNHDLGWAMLAYAQLAIGQHFRTEGQRRRGDELIERYYETIEQAYEAVPDGEHVLLAYTRYINEQVNASPGDEILRGHLNELADRIYERARASDDPGYIHRAASALLTIRDIDRIEQGMEVVREFVERNPDALLHHQLLAMLHYRLEDYEHAEVHLTQVLEADPLPTSFLSQMQPELRRRAAAVLVDTAHQRWARAAAEEQQRLADLVAERHEQLKQYIADQETDPLMIRADAKLALVNQDYHTAAERLERLIRQGGEDYEILMLAGSALERIGQLGLAHERMSQAISAMPVAMPATLYHKARFEYRLGRFEEAQQTIQQLAEIAPEDPRVIELTEAIRQQIDAHARTGPTLQPEATTDDPVVELLERAQRQHDQGDAEGARAIITQGLQFAPHDIRMLAAAARVEVLAGNPELAQEYLAQALQIQPDNRVLRQLEATLTTDDPVEAARQYTRSIHSDDEIEQQIALLLTISALRQQRLQIQQRAESQGELAVAEEAAAAAERFRHEADRVLARVIELAPTDARVIEYRLNRAISASDWEAAERLVEEAARANADQAGGLLYRGAYLIERGRFDQAIRVFQDATDRLPFSSQAWRGLGVAYGRVGNVREALRAFERSYQINPNNISTVREYMGLLDRTGNEIDALRLAQSSRRVFPQNQDLHDYWLDLEARAGDQAIALAERRKQFRTNPEDRRNAMRLALLLTQLQPVDHLLLDEAGSRRYSTRRWTAMGPAEQRRVLENEAVAWRQEANRIVQSIYEHHGRNLETVAFEAGIHQNRGSIEQGERVLREFTASVPEEELDVSHRLVLAQYLIESGLTEAALEELADARQYQNSDVREVDLAIANLRFSLNDYASAKDLYAAVYEVNPSREVALRLIESLVHTGQIDEARSRVATHLPEGQRGDREMIVMALIARGEAERHFERGEVTRGQDKLEEHYRWLDDAIRAMPTNASSHLILAQSKLQEYRRTNRMDLLDEARRALSRAEELSPADSRVAFIRVDMYREQGDMRRAIEEMNRLIERSPMLAQAHRLRLGLNLEAGDLQGAIRAARHSSEIFPQSAMWQEQSARLLLQAGRNAEGADAARRAFDLDRTPTRLAQYLDVEMRLDRTEPQSLLRLLNENRGLLADSPRLQGAFVMLTHRSGDAGAAREAAKQSYGRLRAQLHDGDRDYPDLQVWFNAHSEYFRTYTPVEAEQFLHAAREFSDRDGDDELDFFELTWLARFWASTGLEGMSRGIELAERAERLVPRELTAARANVLFELSGYQIVMEDFAGAVQNLERVVELTPDNGQARNNLAYLLADRFDQPERAEAHAQRAYELLPDNPSVVNTLGWTKFKLGQYGQAETLLRRSLDIQNSATSRVHLAKLLLHTNRREAAHEHLLQAKELNPDRATQEEIDRLLADM